MTLWRPEREDLRAVLLIFLLPFALAAPGILDWIVSDPVLYFAHAGSGDFERRLLRGWQTIDPNLGYQTEALGRLAALDWLHGEVPWWNPYSGVGLPLAAEYQPAVFFPPTFLLLLPHGTAWLQWALQVIAGLGTYALLRQLSASRLAATAGGLLFAFNGTLAWLPHTPSQALAALPWIILGVERAYAKSALSIAGGWRVLCVAMAASLLAGAPEVAYIDGLLALAWSIVRGFQLPAARLDYAARIAAGGGLALALTAPQWVAFIQFLPHAFVGAHERLAGAGLVPQAALPSLVVPYVFGPIFSSVEQWPLLENVWGAIGGYVDIVLIVLAAYGLAARRDAIAWLLGAWCAAALAKTFALEPFVWLWNQVPAISLTAFFRYAAPSWEFAAVLLAAFAIDRLGSLRTAERHAWTAAAAAGALALAASIATIVALWSQIGPHVGIRNPAIGTLVWAAITTAACLRLVRRIDSPRAPVALVALVVADAMLMFAIPKLSSLRSATIDTAAVDFLRANLGLQRFYTLEPFQPNYGGYFGIASINHNYLPVPGKWTAWVREHLDSAADPVSFTGNAPRPKGSPTAGEELRRNVEAFEWAGVKYVVARGEDPLAAIGGVRRVYQDAVVTIFELPAPKPYFQAFDDRCSIQPQSRERAIIDCPGSTDVVRRELFFPGWTASVNGSAAVITEHRDLFQAVRVPAGRSELRFSYAPPGIAWAWLASALAAALLMLPMPRRSRT